MTDIEKKIEELAPYRKMIIAVLNDEHGVNVDAFNRISVICIGNGWDDILEKIEDADGRYWLGEDDAADLEG